jgi:hypothetical protein
LKEEVRNVMVVETSERQMQEEEEAGPSLDIEAVILLYIGSLFMFYRKLIYVLLVNY